MKKLEERREEEEGVRKGRKREKGRKIVKEKGGGGMREEEEGMKEEGGRRMEEEGSKEEEGRRRKEGEGGWEEEGEVRWEEEVDGGKGEEDGFEMKEIRRRRLDGNDAHVIEIGWLNETNCEKIANVEKVADSKEEEKRIKEEETKNGKQKEREKEGRELREKGMKEMMEKEEKEEMREKAKKEELGRKEQEKEREKAEGTNEEEEGREEKERLEKEEGKEEEDGITLRPELHSQLINPLFLIQLETFLKGKGFKVVLSLLRESKTMGELNVPLELLGEVAGFFRWREERRRELKEDLEKIPEKIREEKVKNGKRSEVTEIVENIEVRGREGRREGGKEGRREGGRIMEEDNIYNFHHSLFLETLR